MADVLLLLPELGHFALILAFALACALTLVPSLGYWRRDRLLMALASPIALLQFALVCLAFIGLSVAFLNDDFSLRIVAAQSNTALPVAYKFSALWGGHEGSLLLWILILCGWSAAVALFSRQLPLEILALVLAVLGAVSIGFISFTLLTSNPFERDLLMAPAEGQDLNPLLQDPGMVIHPPMLYFGYVGFSVAFAFAVAALISGRMDATWARWVRPWTNIAWAFLTVGIALGSWWAYYELGWGGWWFWDPVENASFMPWLAGTALMHSLAVSEKRGVFKSWTLLLAIFAFSLSLLGTFLVRSGVLTSVHSFAADPTRGLYILGFLALVVGGSLTLYALRAPSAPRRIAFTASSREALLLMNNVLLVVACLTVLLGTLFPLVMDYAGWGKYSVGPPYFNAVFLPLMALLAVVLGLGPVSNWKNSPASRLKQQLLLAALISVLVALIFPWVYGGDWDWAASAAALLAAWIVLAGLQNLRFQCRNASSFAAGMRRLSPSYYGMQLAHLGFAVTLLGVVITSQYSIEKDLRMAVGESQTLRDYRISFQRLAPVQGPNYSGQQGVFLLEQGDWQTVLRAEKRRYTARSGQIMTEAAIDARLSRDLYVALGEAVGDKAWSVRLHYKPMVRWIWLGAALMALGAVLAVLDKRYRRQKSGAV